MKITISVLPFKKYYKYYEQLNKRLPRSKGGGLEILAIFIVLMKQWFIDVQNNEVS